MRHPTPVLALLATLALPALLTAQSAQRWSVQGSILNVSTSGDAYEGLDAGLGVEAQVRYTPSAFSIGAGYQRSSHDLTFDDGSTETVTLSGVFAEPRYVIDVGSGSYAPYLAGRVAFLTQKIAFEGLEASASGTQLNVGGGVLVRLSPRVNLDLGATYGAIDFDDVKVEFEGQSATIDGSSGSGKNLVLRAGVTVGLR
ncbi:MAG: outer membrane beta-barrel protein [Gemmatimonadetes bacterium]|nr:outer membrane beta-barrel protein [Gemmatimonadota bacterium]MCB9504676.1 outer membrane beta-barrel protein [Gemmatimonadales bacterium]HPF61062.1 outer membrane beta-barrel protein [Gemmatimonadales bacterium]HRX17858.1 outer membrane beta-barrel protein [Gemmatimonadales bacterium]